MSTDIQVISVVDDLQVLSVQEVEGADPRTIQVFGKGGFTQAQRVIINGLGVDSFLVVSNNILLVEPGDALADVPVGEMEIVVVSSILTTGRRARLFFGPTKHLRRVTGVQKLVQDVVKILLTNAGTNKFRLTEGGSLARLTNFDMTTSAKSRLVASLSQAISATEEQLVTAQAGAKGLQLDEKLLSLTLGDVTFLEDSLEVQATVRMVTFAGNTVSVPLIL